MSFIVLLSLFFIQQETGTQVRVESQRFDGFVERAQCDNFARQVEEMHKTVATEPMTDGKEDQPKAEQFQLVVPVAKCLRIR